VLVDEERNLMLRFSLSLLLFSTLAYTEALLSLTSLSCLQRVVPHFLPMHRLISVYKHNMLRGADFPAKFKTLCGIFDHNQFCGTIYRQSFIQASVLKVVLIFRSCLAQLIRRVRQAPFVRGLSTIRFL
jgi:hypothetical protein